MDSPSFSGSTVDDSGGLGSSSFPLVRESYTYTPQGKRDPFRILVTDIQNEGTEIKQLIELQQYELNQLKVLGIIWGGGGETKAKAMILDPNGKVHIVTEGMPLGRQGGKIKRIQEDKVFVEEKRDATNKGEIQRVLEIKK